MLGMHEKGLDEAVIDFAQQGKPILGICVGMQALFEVGEEMGDHPGLGLLPGRVVRFPDFKDIKVPHTGWNQINPCRESPLLVDLPEGSYAYFNHSYYCAPKNEKDSAAMTDYGITFTSAVQHGCVYGVQFHPEKSQLVGRQILANFCKRPV
jgi:glutamine amidotransferase